jgi:hypothetical protein
LYKIEASWFEDPTMPWYPDTPLAAVPDMDESVGTIGFL